MCKSSLGIGLLRAIAYPLLGWCGLASADSLSANDPVMNEILAGRIKMTCGFVHGYGAAAKAGVHIRDMQPLYDVGDWINLATMVGSIGSGIDGFWYVLGRSAESLGQWDLATKYYNNALGAKAGCHCMGRTCLTSSNVQKLAEDRKAGIDQVQKVWPEWSADERDAYLASELRRHVTFYGCLRWAEGRSVADLSQSLIVGGAEAIEALVSFQRSVGGVDEARQPIGIKAATANTVYRQIQLPRESPDRGLDREEVVRNCMTANSFVVNGLVLSPSAWHFSQ